MENNIKREENTKWDFVVVDQNTPPPPPRKYFFLKMLEIAWHANHPHPTLPNQNKGTDDILDIYSHYPYYLGTPPSIYRNGPNECLFEPGDFLRPGAYYCDTKL